ncbi:MAG: hypothetical protein IIA62_04275 [Nitrospinae bacterium]|nr:hypothetical protein [Nitrospinota bacterium]
MPPEVHISGSHVVQGFMVPVRVAGVNEPFDLMLQFPGEALTLKLDDILHGAVVQFDLALRHGMIGRSLSMGHTPFFQIGFQFA